MSSKASGGTLRFCGALALPPEDELDDEDELLEELEELPLDDELEEELDDELEELEDELELDELLELLELLTTGPTEHQAELVKLFVGNADSEQVKLPVIGV